jgi:hypothetical protein
LNTVSEEITAIIDTTSKLVLKKRGDSAVEFTNAANRLYIHDFIELAEIGCHRVLFSLLRLSNGKRRGTADKDKGRMVVAMITQYPEGHHDKLFFCQSNNCMTNAINRIFHLWARSNWNMIDDRVTYFDGAGQLINIKEPRTPFRLMSLAF